MSGDLASEREACRPLVYDGWGSEVGVEVGWKGKAVVGFVYASMGDFDVRSANYTLEGV
jgi:hypothetical protein